MGQLAAGLKTMQQSLTGTVSAVVRDNADFIYILAQAKFPPAAATLSSVPNSRASALEENRRQHGTVNRHGTAKHR